MCCCAQAAVPGAAAAPVPDPGEPAAAAGPRLPRDRHRPRPRAQPALARLQPYPRAGGDQGVTLHRQEGIPQRPRGEEQDMEEKVCTVYTMQK